MLKVVIWETSVIGHRSSSQLDQEYMETGKIVDN